MPPKGRQGVEAEVERIQQLLADGDPEDAALRRDCSAALEGLRACYRAEPKSFAPETIEALRELADILRGA